MTNAGKTYTVTGPTNQPGLLPRTLAETFQHLDRRQWRVGPEGGRVSVLVSYLEIYNEQVYDLLAAFNAGGGGSAAPPAGFTREALVIKDGRWVAVAGLGKETARARGRRWWWDGTVGRTTACWTRRDPATRPHHMPRRDGRVYVRNLRQVLVSTPEEAVAVMLEGTRSKQVRRVHAGGGGAAAGSSELRPSPSSLSAAMAHLQCCRICAIAF
jgi:hypothetical protein